MKFVKVAVLFFGVMTSVSAADLATTQTPISPVAKAAQPTARDRYYSSGFYLGLNIGRAISDSPDIAGFDRNRVGDVGRAYIGYNANYYFSLDVGYLLLPTVTYNSPALNFKVANEGYDALLTAKYPLGEGFVVYAKGGPALMRARYVSPLPVEHENATVLEYGGGIDYVWANIGGLHTLLDVTHLNGKNTGDFTIPGYNLYTFGVYYQF